MGDEEKGYENGFSVVYGRGRYIYFTFGNWVLRHRYLASFYTVAFGGGGAGSFWRLHENGEQKMKYKVSFSAFLPHFYRTPKKIC